jgi:nucleolar pre-ribosomal-associated protein 2
LEDAHKAAGQSNTGEGSTIEKKSSKFSKKRKRSPELDLPSETVGLIELLDAIYTAVEILVQSTKSITAISEEGRSAAFSAEYMKTAIKAPAQESATILGLWFSLSAEVLKSRNATLVPSPFIEIWDARAADDSELIQFSRHALVSLMSLLRFTKKERLRNDEWTAQLEQLVARNVMIPAKTEKSQNAESVLLPTLARIPVITNTANAPIFFDIAIRSIVTHGTQRRRAEDEAWLQHVFSTMQDALLPQRPEENSEALCAMLQSAKKYKVDIELSTLRTITSKFALTEKRDDWNLVAKIIALDANVFLIPNTERDLLSDLLTRITKAGLQPEWAELADQVVCEVVVPLMNEFAKARDLSGFIHHWHDQLVALEKLMPRNSKDQPSLFNAWEDEALQTELSKLLEPSLTLQQINQILDWLSTANIYPRSVIVDAIAGSISRDETVDAIDTRLVHMISNHKETMHMNPRFTWRTYRILSRTSNWIMAPGLRELSKLWKQGVPPFNVLTHPTSTLLGEKLPDNKAYPHRLETLRCSCALWSAARAGSQLEKLSKASLQQFIPLLEEDLKTFIESLSKNMDVGQSISSTRVNTVRKDDGYTKWTLVRSIFAKYPKVLT